MHQFITAIIATASLITLVIYDLLSVCRIIRKEKWAEKVWKYMLPNRPYNETMLFVAIRPMLLSVSFMTFILSGGVLAQLVWFDVLLKFTSVFAMGVIISTNTRKH